MPKSYLSDPPQAITEPCQPTPVFLPGESQGQGSLVGCCLWGCTESDTTEVTQQQQQQQQHGGISVGPLLHEKGLQNLVTPHCQACNKNGKYGPGSMYNDAPECVRIFASSSESIKHPVMNRKIFHSFFLFQYKFTEKLSNALNQTVFCGFFLYLEKHMLDNE